jgi:hypothetical protein
MYSIRYNSYIQQQQLIFDNRQMIKTNQYVFWSTKFYNKPRDVLPSQRTLCGFQKARKGERYSQLEMYRASLFREKLDQ